MARVVGLKNGRTAPRIGLISGGDHLSGYAPEHQALGNAGGTDLFMLRERELDDWRRLQFPRNYLRQATKHNFDNFDVLINLITDPDQHPQTLEILGKVLRNYDGRLLNAPARVLRTGREKVASMLTGIAGLVVPEVSRFIGHANQVRAAQAVMDFPAILRRIGTHSGEIVGVVDGAGDLPGLVKPQGEYFLTRLVDSAGADGLYRKMRVFFIGEEMVIRHLLVSDHWSVHSPDRARFMADRPTIRAEEQAMLEGGIEALPETARAALHAIRAAIGLDLFGADLGLRPDGGLVLFEANATMNFFPFSRDPRFAYGLVAYRRAREAYGRLLHPHGLPELAAA